MANDFHGTATNIKQFFQWHRQWHTFVNEGGEWQDMPAMPLHDPPGWQRGGIHTAQGAIIEWHSLCKQESHAYRICGLDRCFHHSCHHPKSLILRWAANNSSVRTWPSRPAMQLLSSAHRNPSL